MAQLVKSLDFRFRHLWTLTLKDLMFLMYNRFFIYNRFCTFSFTGCIYAKCYYVNGRCPKILVPGTSKLEVCD